MKLKTYFLAITLFFFAELQAQQFISKAKIEFEVKANIKKTMGQDSFLNMIDDLPTFKTGYYTFTFADNKSIYKFDHWSENLKVPDWLKESDEDNVWYINYNTGKCYMQKNVWGSILNIEDSITSLHWKITNDTHVIAGFNCRKAVTQIFDSVYVFAFYTDEIILPGGPCSINGLPGMILGVTIPRLYTSWIATKVILNNIDESTIKPISARKFLNMKDLKAALVEHTKDWHSDDPDENAENQQQKARFFWETML